jgi:hypothetical protein
MKLVWVALLTLMTAGTAVAQGATDIEPASSPRLEIALPEALLTQSTPRATEPRDSLKNGAIMGAVVGAGALGGFGLWLCEMLKEPGNPSCWPGTLVVAGIGAGIGAAAGAGIDALADRAAASPRAGAVPGDRRIGVAWKRRF